MKYNLDGSDKKYSLNSALDTSKMTNKEIAIAIAEDEWQNFRQYDEYEVYLYDSKSEHLLDIVIIKTESFVKFIAI